VFFGTNVVILTLRNSTGLNIEGIVVVRRLFFLNTGSHDNPGAGFSVDKEDSLSDFGVHRVVRSTGSIFNTSMGI